MFKKELRYPRDSKSKEMIKKDKELYNTNIIQGMFEQIDELRQRIIFLEAEAKKYKSALEELNGEKDI